MGNGLIEGLLALHPRGATTAQLLWRLNAAGRGPGPSALLENLMALVNSGAVRHAHGRWHLLRAIPVQAEAKTVLPGASVAPATDTHLPAIPMHWQPREDAPDFPDGALCADWGALMTGVRPCGWTGSRGVFDRGAGV